MNFFNIFLSTFILLKCVSAQQSLPTGCLDAFRTAAFAAHNQYRALCGVPSLAESDTIGSSAQAWATQMATTNVFAHSGNSLYGENLYVQFSSSALSNVSACSTLGVTCVESWYNEITSYDFSNPGYSDTTGHYTQVVWKSSSLLGMGLGWGIQSGGLNSYYCVGQYSPAGNNLAPGQFAANV
jgi:uncharacterized protein YkwD